MAEDWNRAFGVDANILLNQNSRLSAFLARTDTPQNRRTGPRGTGYSGRAFYNYTDNVWQVSGGYSQVDRNFNPEVGFLPRRGYRRPEFRLYYQQQSKRIAWVRRVAPHISYNSFWDIETGKRQSEAWHIHPFEIQPRQGGRFGWFVDYTRDNPTSPFMVYNRDGRRVTIPVGEYSWHQHAFEYFHNPSARVTGTIRARVGKYDDGDFNGVEITSDYRITPKITASLGWIRQNIDLPYASFHNDLVPIKANISFTTLINLSSLLQYNGQTGQFSSNLRFAWLNRSGTGLFVVFNDRRDLLSSTAVEALGRSFVVKFTRLVDF